MFSGKFTHINQAKGAVSRESLLRRVRLETQHLGKVEKSPMYKRLKEETRSTCFRKGRENNVYPQTPIEN